MSINGRRMVFYLVMILALAVGCASAAGYILGPGDMITIRLVSPDEFTSEVVVRPDGEVTIDFIGDVRVGGLDSLGAAEIIKRKFERLYVKPIVTVTVKEMRPVSVKVFGEVVKPGTYYLKSINSRLLDAIAAAGGTLSSADTRFITITGKGRNGLSPVDLDIALRNTAGNAQLADGDSVSVPKLKPISVLGEVMKPDSYMASVRGVPLVELIASAGGFTKVADSDSIRILSPSDSSKVEFEGSVALNPNVLPGSTVEVKARAITNVLKATPYLQTIQILLAIITLIFSCAN